ncbi:MAG: Hsp20/alpha crystallin family protein [Myxococcales bacterium]|nr:Hsp20/alpha crystallin family protein [Myxococcales bacterium]
MNPFREIEELSHRLDRLFALGRWDGGERETLAATDWSPVCDISETDKEYRIAVELPNVKKEDVHVRLQDGVLTIEGQRREEKEDKGVRFHRRELSFGAFVRRFTMPADADEAKVDASFKDGMLNISIAKTKAKQTQGREIAVH